MVNCAVVGCTSNSSRVKKIGYHKLPSEEKNPEIRRAWLEKLSKVDPVTKQPLFVLRKDCYVCTDHFTEDDYEFSVKFLLTHFPNMRTNRLLKKGAVPSKNLDLPSQRGLPLEDPSLEERLGSEDIHVITSPATTSRVKTSPATTSRVKTSPAKISTVKTLPAATTSSITSTAATLRPLRVKTLPAIISTVQTLPAKISTVKTLPGTTSSVKILPANISTVKTLPAKISTVKTLPAATTSSITSPATSLRPSMAKTLPAEKSTVGTSQVKTSPAKKTAVRIGPDGQVTTYSFDEDGYLNVSKYHYDDDTSNHLEPHLGFRTSYKRQLNRSFIPAKNRILLPKGESSSLVTSNQTNFVQICSPTTSVSSNTNVKQPKTKPDPKNKKILKTAVPTTNRMLWPKLDSSSPEQVASFLPPARYVKIGSQYVQMQPSVKEIVSHRPADGPVKVRLLNRMIETPAAPSKNPVSLPNVDASVSNASKHVVFSAVPELAGCARVTPIRPLMTDSDCNKDCSVNNQPAASVSLGFNVAQSGDQAAIVRQTKTRKAPALKTAIWTLKTNRVLRKSSIPSKYRIFKSKGESSKNESCPVMSPEAADHLTSPETADHVTSPEATDYLTSPKEIEVIDILTPPGEFVPFELISDEFKIEMPDDLTDCVKIEESDPLSSSFADSAGVCDHGSPLKEESYVKIESDSTDTADESEMCEDYTFQKRNGSTTDSEISHKRQKMCQEESLSESDFDLKPDLVKLENPNDYDCDLSVCEITEDAATQCEMGCEIYRIFNQNSSDSPTKNPKIRVKNLSELTNKDPTRPISPSDFMVCLEDTGVQCEMGKEIYKTASKF